MKYTAHIVDNMFTDTCSVSTIHPSEHPKLALHPTYRIVV